MPGTLAELKEDNTRVWANCGDPDCGRGKVLDIDMLIARFGADHDCINETRIKAAIRCEVCGHRGGDLTFIPDSTPNG